MRGRASGWDGPPSGIGSRLFRDRRGETVFCLSVLIVLPGFLVSEPGRRACAAAGRAAALLFGGTCCPKISCNATAAIATLRNLASVEGQFQSMAKADVDGDGIGEFGTFAELTGTEGVRTSADGTTRGAPVSPALLSPALANVDGNGIVTKSGYCFRIFLPAAGGASVHEGRASSWTGGAGSPAGCCGRPAVPPTPRVLVPGTAFSGPVDGNLAERRWCAYAWPAAKGNSGTRVFYVDETGNVLQCANTVAGYSGMNGGPIFDASFSPGRGPGWGAPVAGGTGKDGEVWKATN